MSRGSTLKKILVLILLTVSLPLFAQEEESAEFFLEEYSDQFQEMFFEGLKQKGIENYDRAIQYLLQCKEMQPDNIVLDHELAKTYLLDGQYINAEPYALRATNADPDNYWYLQTLFEIVEAQYKVIDVLKDELAWNKQSFVLNLAEIYFAKGDYVNAEKTIDRAAASQEKHIMIQKLKMSATEIEQQVQEISEVTSSSEEEGSVVYYTDTIEELIRQNKVEQVIKLTDEAMEKFPVQPFFYYAKGWAYIQGDDYEKAASILEMGAELIFEQSEFSNRMYSLLVEVFGQLNQTEKADKYRSLIKTGS